ncbi:decarboxylating 6-phosphogluconate dehydrogenase [Rhodococcus sp. USK10]|uniref:phosphogluconate dehydrogenase (NAD(+)-dependent, decarboxylating) n=1 Tax=Rhodococcus sp. USK10 TaxID=2789739 RepID=UPI001C5DD4E6|nr:decarboxylating 6-phosphogluconate dehydrogenase [Rhodococcus sp. USK10]QYB07418.1 decarboxylating 6-phosphogluconate dehydrogenase [Rhodococcus sp. USK10]
MRMGLVGLGRMGHNMRERLRARGHDVVGFDPGVSSSDVDSLAAMVASLDGPRVVWIMVPHGKATSDTVRALGDLLDSGDLVIEGGNSRFTDDQAHAERLAPRGIDYIDCGVSGGVWGKDLGYALMVGGVEEAVARAMPIFESLLPEGDSAKSFVHAGPVGAGHFAKMIHNGVEYGLMQAYAEGYELLSAEQLVTDVRGVLEAWTAGTVVRSWLLDLLVEALRDDPGLATLSGFVDDSGEGRWTVEEAIGHSVPVPVISAALFARFSSRQDDSPAMKAVSALRRQFGGHAVQKVAP